MQQIQIEEEDSTEVPTGGPHRPFPSFSHAMAVLIKADSRVLTVKPKTKRGFTLAEMYRVLDCTMVEFIYPKTKCADTCPKEHHKHILIVDEEGLYKKDPQWNPLASRMAGRNIVGDVLAATIINEGKATEVIS